MPSLAVSEQREEKKRGLSPIQMMKIHNDANHVLSNKTLHIPF